MSEERVIAEPAPLASITRWKAYPWIVVGTTCLGAFAGQVDASIVQLGLPALEQAFDARLDAVSWVAIAYSLAFAAALPVYARLAEMGGRKVMYIAGFALFGLFSALCGLATSLPWLIAFRVCQGLAGALLGANSVVILVAAAGPERRGRAMGLFAAAQAVGVCIGPALGGLILGDLSWRWIFWVTVPVAALAAVLGRLVVPAGKPRATVQPFDVPGAMMLVPALALLMLAITKLHAWGPLSPQVLVCLGLSLALLAAFVRREARAPAPLLNLELFRSPAFAGGVAGVLLSYAMLYGMFLAMSFALVRGAHDAPLAAGLRLSVVPLALGLVAPFSGSWAQKRPGAVMLGGMALCLAGLAVLAFVLSHGLADGAAFTLGLALYGAGLGLFIAPNNTATLAAAPPEHAGQAGGLLNLMRAMGTAIGVAATSSLLAWGIAGPDGVTRRSDLVDEATLLTAARDCLALLAVFAILAAAAATLRARAHANDADEPATRAARS